MFRGLSGGYAFHGHVPERDGIVSNLYLLDAMVKTGKTPTQLVQALFDKVGAHYYDRIDIRCNSNPSLECPIAVTKGQRQPTRIE